MDLFIHHGLYFGKTKPEITMPTVAIRKSGNANIVALPKALLEQLGVGIGDRLDVVLQDDRIVLSPAKSQRPTLEELFAGVTPEMFQTEEDIEWLEMPSVGKELL
nr:AbrB/MazE/SpoVT family DNA-binding domain-containing protein [uncultured Cardiobacterium sp.]